MTETSRPPAARICSVYRAAWVLPITSDPLRHGWVQVDGRGRIVAVATGSPPRGEREIDLGHVALLPGLVNAHTHLELSWLRGRIPPARSLPDWIRALLTVRREVQLDDPLAMAAAVADARRAGTSVVGDITNTLTSVHALAASPLAGCVFYELLGFNHPRPEERVGEVVARVSEAARGRIRTSVAPHAPYSVSPALFRAIAAAARRERWITSVHLGESAEEIEFLRTGGGPWRDLLQQLGVWTEAWHAPGTGPVAFLESLGVLTADTLVVHGVRLTDAELQRLAAIGATVVTCPRSNTWVGAGEPPVSRFYASGVRVAIGTDSLASCPDLNLFAELPVLRRLAPELPARRLLHSATRAGAEALGFAADHGAIAPGCRADLIAVDAPAATRDVEEYLCSGIQPEQVRWIHEAVGV